MSNRVPDRKMLTEPSEMRLRYKLTMIGLGIFLGAIAAGVTMWILFKGFVYESASPKWRDSVLSGHVMMMSVIGAVAGGFITGRDTRSLKSVAVLFSAIVLAVLALSAGVGADLHETLTSGTLVVCSLAAVGLCTWMVRRLAGQKR